MNEDLTPLPTDENGRDTLGRFTAGNPGRPKGTGNKLKKELQEALTEFVADKVPDIYALYHELDARDKLSLLLNISRLVVPRPKESSEGSEESAIFKPIDLDVPVKKLNIPLFRWAGEGGRTYNYIGEEDLARLTDAERANLAAIEEKLQLGIIRSD
jgi:hypothetical protein